VEGGCGGFGDLWMVSSLLWSLAWCLYRGVFLVVSVVLLEWIQWAGSEHTAISKLEIARDFSLQAGSPQPQLCHA
jgi:hypothetical protein